MDGSKFNAPKQIYIRKIAFMYSTAEKYEHCQFSIFVIVLHTEQTNISKSPPKVREDFRLSVRDSIVDKSNYELLSMAILYVFSFRHFVHYLKILCGPMTNISCFLKKTPLYEYTNLYMNEFSERAGGQFL